MESKAFDTGTLQRCCCKGLIELVRRHLSPAFGRIVQRIKERIEGFGPMLRSTPIVRTAALTGITTEDPPFKIDGGSNRLFDGMTRNTAPGIDGMIFAHRMRGAAIDAPAACTAPDVAERCVVTIAGRGENQLAQQDESPVLRRDKQRLPADPPQPRLDGQLLFEQRRGIHESPSRKVGEMPPEPPEKVEEHPFDRDMIVGRQGIRCDFGSEAVGIAVAQRVFAAHGADDDTPCAGDQPPHVETLVEVAFQITQRRMAALGEPPAEKTLVVGKLPAGGHAAEIETGRKGFTDNILVEEHINISIQI